MPIRAGIARGDTTMAKNFDFAIIDQWQGYNSNNDKSNVAENVMVQGSQNIYKKLSGNLANRPGQKRIGDANSTQSPVSSEFIWNTSWGATYPLWITNNTLQVSINNIWYTLLSNLTKTRYVFDKWWNYSQAKDRVLFVCGDSNIYSWSGGFTTIFSTTSSSITKTGSTTWQLAGFSTISGEKSILINGNTYTYTGGENTGTLTGVSPSPIGELNGSNVFQSVLTQSNTPSSTFSNDFLKVINNQVYIGSYTSRLCYISSNTDFTNYTVPTPRLSGSAELLTLDSTLNGIGVKSGNAAISIGTGEWAIISFTNITVGTTLTQQTNVDVKPVAKLAAAYAHEFISNSGDNLIYLAKDQQVREFGNFNDLFFNAYPSTSLEIATELSAENFSGGALKCIGEFTYITAPVSGKVYLYQVRQGINANNSTITERLWHSPFIWNSTRIDEINGMIVAFSNANPQIYQVWDTNQWHDDSPSNEALPYKCVLALSYRNGARRQGLIKFDKCFTEGYITQGTELNLTMNYNWQGSTNILTSPINSISRPAFIFQPAISSLGDSAFGDKPIGNEIQDQSNNSDMQNLCKFIVFSPFTLVNVFEYQPIYITDTKDARWEILAHGTNAKIEDEQQPTFALNKSKN